MNSSHIQFMLQALSLAKKGLGSVSPNPMVGCVIVKEGEIVAEGYHQKYGEAHAEVNAIEQLPRNIHPSECTLYVTLEPCSHFGKTPPCADLIISKGFKKVVICNTDSNPLVGGKGIEKMQKAGIEVITGVLENEGRFLNRRFFTFHEKKRPYVILKWAQTNDGFISRDPIPVNKADNWISGPESKKAVHQLRAEEDAILVGKNTVLADDPELTTRLVLGKNPVRIVIADELAYDPKFAIFNKAAKTLIYNTKTSQLKENIEWVKLSSKEDVISQVLADLKNRNIASLMVEGGSNTLINFLKSGNWDEIQVFVNPKKEFKTGLKAPEFAFPTDYQYIGEDKRYVVYSSAIF